MESRGMELEGSMEGTMEGIEKDYREGLLTEKGYKRRKLTLQLEQTEEDYRNGDLTEIGYKRKKQKISEELNSTTTGATSTGSTICSDLSCGESVHATLSKIFKYKQPESKSIQFKPSALIAKASSSKGTSTSSKKTANRKDDTPAKLSKMKPPKPITVVMLAPECATVIPRDKNKLRSEKRLGYCSFTPEDTEDAVKNKIQSAFPKIAKEELVFLQATQTGDLFSCSQLQNKDFSANGETVLMIAGAGSLYVTIRQQPVTKSSSSPVVVTVHPIKNKQPQLVVASKTSQVTKEMKTALRQNLFDNRFFYLVRSESFAHQPSQEEDPLEPKVILDREKGEFLLSINIPVHCWLIKRENDGLPKLKLAGNFCVVTDELYEEFESFKSVYPGTNVESMLPLNELLFRFMDKQAIDIHTIDVYGHKFVNFPSGMIDELCIWIMSGRENFNNLGFVDE